MKRLEACGPAGLTWRTWEVGAKPPGCVVPVELTRLTAAATFENCVRQPGQNQYAGLSENEVKGKSWLAGGKYCLVFDGVNSPRDVSVQVRFSLRNKLALLDESK